ncbi:hypothetical protein [Streptomyces sp. NPDC014894]
MPNAQSTPEQRARRDARQGAKYTTALRAHTGAATYDCPFGPGH